MLVFRARDRKILHVYYIIRNIASKAKVWEEGEEKEGSGANEGQGRQY